MYINKNLLNPYNSIYEMKGGVGGVGTAFVGINQSMGQYRAPPAGADMYGVLAILPQRCELLF